ncbi:MAG TPA: nucleoside monophosphate kinase [Bryobacteraceae bacterium]|nr:nucleoside monophosphate kinase [Bryobacteraceae bacterium]
MNRSRVVSLVLWMTIGLHAVAQMQAPRVFILIGPPGSGKTVQARQLSRQYKIPAISMAELLKQEVGRKTPMGKALAASLESGELVADAPANQLMKGRLLRADAGRGFILDGYPASEGQARALDAFLAEHSFTKPVIIVINAPEEVLRSRMTGRRRADDQPANIDRRLADYRQVGRVVEQWYGSERIVRVDGAGTPAEVTARIAQGIDALPSAGELKVRTPLNAQ